MESTRLPTEKAKSEVSISTNSHVSGGAGGGTTAVSTTTAGFSSSASTEAARTNKRSHKLLRVMLGQKEPHRITPDPLGEALTRILCRHPAWNDYRRRPNRSSPSTTTPSTTPNPFIFQYPLLGRHNLNLLKIALGDIWKNKQQWVPLLRGILQPPSLASLRQTIQFFLQCLALAILLHVTVTHAVVTVVSRQVWWFTSSVLFLLIDWNELAAWLRIAAPDEDNNEATDRNVLSRILAVGRWMDFHFLGGKRWNAREWDRTTNVTIGRDPSCTAAAASSSSVQSSLWELPPPTIKQGRRLCLDPKYLQQLEQDSWSEATVNHRVAIHFCYVMIREDYLQKQANAAARRKQQQRHYYGRSVTSLEGESPEKEAIRLRHCSNSLGATDPLSSLGYHWNDDSDNDNYIDDDATGAAVTVVMNNRSESSYDTTRRRRQRGIPTSPHEAIELLDVAGISPIATKTEVGITATTTSRCMDEWMLQNNSGSPGSPDCLSEQGSVASDIGDMPWLDVGAKIGMRILNSAHVHRAIADPTLKSKIEQRTRRPDNAYPDDESCTSGHRPPYQQMSQLKLERLSKPVHSIWTSPSAAAASVSIASPTGSENGELIGGQVHGSANRKDHHLASYAKRRHHISELSDQNGLSTSTSVEVQLQLDPLANREQLASSSQHPDADVVTQATSEPALQRKPLLPGVKVAVPLFPIQPRCKHPSSLQSTESRRSQQKIHSCYQMGTVVRSRRIFVGTSHEHNETATQPPNCLSVTVKLDKAYLRNAEFAELTFRVMDEWTSARYMPRHSKVPIGSCVATTFGLGVVVGWRVQDSIHVVRSLWQRRGKGSAHAYLQASALHSTVEAAIGFDVHTKYGKGTTLAYVNGGKTFESGRFFVAIKEEGRYHGHVLELHRKDLYSCLGAQFIPVIEHIREAAHYKIQLDNYEAALREQNYEDSQETDDERLWKDWSACLDILWNSFLKAVDEDSAFDEGVNVFMTSIIEFLERLDETEVDNESIHELAASDFEVECYMAGVDPSTAPKEKEAPGLWVINDILGGVFRPHQQDHEEDIEASGDIADSQRDSRSKYYNRVFAVLRTIMKTVSLAKAESVDHPHFRLALAITHDFLLFVRTIVKVQQKNSSNHSLEVWKKAFDEIALTFGPLKDRLEKIGRGIAQRMEKQGRRAKTRVLRFVDTVLGDEKLLFAMEQGEWDQCISRVELALIKSSIVQEKSLFYYRKTGQFIYDHLQASISNGGGAATRNNEKIELLAQGLRSIASPLRSILKVFLLPDVLDLFERILVRVYCREEEASRILTIHASNFHSLRHLRMLKDFSVAGRIWIPLLDAADEEFSWVVSQLPEQSKEFMCPLSNLFSLCIAQFHKINAGDLSKDWLDFLLEDEAAKIIQDIDMKLILALESFSRDVREMMTVLPYYPSIDDDILKLMDEVNLDDFLKEASTAIDDPETLSRFLREKVTIAIERFLNYLPRMSIPVERRELGDGWVLTCRGQDGSDLTLSDVKVKRENLVCQILGGDTLFFPMFVDDEAEETPCTGSSASPTATFPVAGHHEEESILDHIRGLLLQAQSHGCWREGIGGVGEPPTDRYVAAVLQGLPVSSVLNCAIELWRNLEIDDDELLEIAIRDVSYQIQLQKAREEGGSASVSSSALLPYPEPGRVPQSRSAPSSLDSIRRRFNPRVDPTVLFLEMKNLTLHLDNFMFRIEKSKKRTVFDPVFEGRGMVLLQNINIRMRVVCAKERGKRGRGGGPDGSAPMLQIQELAVELEKMQLRVKDTGFGSDWLLNRAVHVFGDNITKVVEENLRDQVLEQSRATVEGLNTYFAANPHVLLNLLGVSMDDLDERVVFV